MNALLFATSPQLLSIVVPKGWQVLLLLSVQAPTALCQKAPKLHHARAEWSTILHIESRLSGRLDAAGALGGTGLEAVGELAGDGLQVLHAAGTGGLSPLGLLAPVVCGGMLVLVLFSCSRINALSVVGSSLGGLEEGGVRRTLPDGGARVTAVGASVLLDVERATTLSVR
jgi:hypothetical protein